MVKTKRLGTRPILEFAMPASSNSSLELDKGVDFMTSYGSKKKDSSQDEKTIGLDPKVQDEVSPLITDRSNV